MKSNSEVKKRLPRSVKKYIRRQKSELRRQFKGGELEAAMQSFMEQFYKK